jgi:hypothetical protein
VASEGEIKQRFSHLEAWLDERSRRLWAAAESAAHGRGGISLVARASGVSRRAIAVGLAELQKKPDRLQRMRLPIRQKGGGRKKSSLKDPDLLLDLEKLLEPVTRGDPQSPLRWTCKSVRNLADELRAQGHEVSHMLVAELLHEQKYSLQANRKTKEGSSHPDRNAQFEHINAKATGFLKSGQPAISVDTKKKEQVGEYKNAGREWRPKGQPETVKMHDFGKQKDVPYGVYDLGQNAGWVSVGTDHDTSAFAVETSMVEHDGSRGVPRCASAFDNGGQWRQQRIARAVVETGVAGTGRRNRSGDLGLSLPARNQQMEPDRASSVLLHHEELARQTVGEP